MTLNNLHNNQELLLRIAEGDEAAFKVIFTEYWDQIYSTAFYFTKSPEVAEDLTQDIFAQCWVKREALVGINNFQSYLYITARNLIFDRLRKKEFNGTEDEYIRRYFANFDEDPTNQLEFKEFNALIHTAIGRGQILTLKKFMHYLKMRSPDITRIITQKLIIIFYHYEVSKCCFCIEIIME